MAPHEATHSGSDEGQVAVRGKVIAVIDVAASSRTRRRWKIVGRGSDP